MFESLVQSGFLMLKDLTITNWSAPFPEVKKTADCSFLQSSDQFWSAPSLAGL